MSGLVDWPAAERNKQPILEVLERVLPKRGLVLEIASATGQHVAHFARALPELTFQPSDFSEEHLQNVRARRAVVGLTNILPPVLLDVTQGRWPVERADAIFNANMIHISPWAATLGLFAGAERLLATGAPLVTYGPYKLHGEHVSESNVEFDASLRERDPSFGVRDVDEVSTVAEARGFTLEERVPMPANNFTLIFRRR
jgi:SAM-dependent methyltransferase